MKRILSIALVMVLCFALAGSALAVFTPSVTYKPVPDFAGSEADDGCQLIGYVEQDGQVIGEVHHDEGEIYAVVEAVHETGCDDDHKCLILTPLAEAETSTEIPEDSREMLLWVYQQLLEKGISFIDCSELDAYIKQVLGENATIEDLVVRDLFDVSVLCDPLREYLEPEGTTICLDFDLDLEPHDFVAVVCYKDGQWKMIEDVEVDAKGDLTCTTYEDFCPVAILVADAKSEGPAGGSGIPSTGAPATGAPAGGKDAPASGHVPASTDAPETGVEAQNNVTVWAVVAVAALAALVVLFVMQRKSKREQ